jgi:methylmalonyl-CoA mutase
LEKVFGRHTAVIEDDFRVYWAQAGDSPLIAEVLAAVLAATDAFAEAVGRRPRILVARMGRVMKTGAEWRVRERPDDGVAPDAG